MFVNLFSPSLHSSPIQRCHDRDLINLIFLLIKDNPSATDRFQTVILNKIEAFLTPILANANDQTETPDYPSNSCLNIVSSLFQVSGATAINSPLKHELMLLSALMQRQDDSCWEQRLRLVIHILLRSLNTVSGSKGTRVNNPVLMECLTLPCLRILNHVCKTTTVKW